MPEPKTALAQALPESIKAWADRKRTEAILSDEDRKQISDEAAHRKGDKPC